MSSDGTVLYASSMNSAWSWKYDAAAQSASGQRSLVGGMAGSDHVTRTLLLSEKVKDMLIISRGSDSNVDLIAADISSGHSQIRAFNISELTDGQNFTYASDGLRLGWGLRNSVGVAEHPITGGIWSVENSADDLRRNGVSIRQENPAEELNFHGYLNGTKDVRQGANFGYPQCYAVWNSTALPQNTNLPVGAQFAPDGSRGNDTYCASQMPPRLAFLAHQAPLDIRFNNTGTEAWISFHGSWYVLLNCRPSPFISYAEPTQEPRHTQRL
jgi:glucose/arabinose dehydrogenase